MNEEFGFYKFITLGTNRWYGNILLWQACLSLCPPLGIYLVYRTSRCWLGRP